MSDEQQKRAQPITFNERPSTADRVKQIQEMQERMNVQQAPAAPAAPQTAKPAAPAVATTHAATVFDASQVREVGAHLRGELAPSADASTYAKAQVDQAKLFGQADNVALAGNPWKVIDFSPMLPALFEPPKPLSEYQASVPDQAVQTDQGLLFQVELKPKDGQEPAQRRAVLTTGDGKLAGAECKNPAELSRLLSRSPEFAQQLYQSAFGGARGGNGAPKLLNVAAGRRGAFEVTVGQGSESRTVQVNNFGRPVPEGTDPARSNLIVANYMLDRFEPTP